MSTQVTKLSCGLDKKSTQSSDEESDKAIYRCMLNADRTKLIDKIE